MTLSIVPASAWLATSLVFQTGSVPIWVPLAIILIIILLFWWGLTRGNIPTEEETRGEHDAQPAGDGQDSDGEVVESEAEIVETDSDKGHQPAQESEDDQNAYAGTEELPQADDLTKIEGIGPKIAGILADAGIITYAQLAGASSGQLEQIVREDAGIKIADPASWPQQAALAANGDWDGLKALQKSLVAGRLRE